MKKLLIVLALFLFPGIASAAVTFPINGGTGSTTLSGILFGNGTSPVKTLTIGTNLTLSGSTLSASGGSGGTGVGTVSTSTTPVIGQLSYWTGTGWPSTLGTVATGTISASGGITATAGQSVIGSGLTIGCTSASGSAAGCLSSTDWTTFNGKQNALGSLTGLIMGNAGSFYGAATSSPISMSITGNAGTATTLQTARAINGVNFDGSAAITIAAASSTLLSDNNTFSGNDSFTKLLNLTYASSTAISASGTIYAANFYDTNTTGSSCIGDSSGILENGNCVKSIASSGGTITVSSPTGAVNVDLALAHANTWTALQQFGNASTTGLTTTYFYNTGITSALGLYDANHKEGAYAGSSCTNQFVRSLNGAGVATCNSVSLTADVTGTLPIGNGGTNAASFGTSNGIVAYNGTSLVNFSGYTLTSTGLTATNASTTNLTAGTSFQIPNSSNPSPTVSGYITQSTNAPYQLHLGGAGTTAIFDPRHAFVLTVSSTTVLVGTTTSPAFVIPFGLTVTNMVCTVQPNGGTAEVLWNYANATAYTTVNAKYLAASTTPGNIALSSNNTPTALATSTLSVGSPAGSATSASCTFYGTQAAI